MTEQFTVTGMTCSACKAHVEKAILGVRGVSSCQVNLITGDVLAQGEFSAAEVVSAVKKAGYGASVKVRGKKPADPSEETGKTKKRQILRLIFSAAILIVLFWVNMGYSMGGLPLPGGFRNDPVSVGICEAVLALCVMVLNRRFFISGVRSVLHLAPNMDTLVSLGSGVSFAYSGTVLILTAAGRTEGKPDYYFEAAAMILTFISVGKLLETSSKGKAARAMEGLRSLVPDTCRVLRDGNEEEISVDSVRVGDVLTVRPGDRAALDALVLTGSGDVDESAVTGESLPVTKKPGDRIFAGSLDTAGCFTAEVTSPPGDTTVDRMADLVRQVAADKAPVARAADRVAAIFVPAVLGIALITLAGWLAAGKETGFAVGRAVSVLVVSCPCALGLATPVAILCGSTVAARRGVLFRSAEALENCGKIRTVAFDKTGTVTEGKMQVTGCYPAAGVSESKLISSAVLTETGSTHPIAAAILDLGKERGISAPELSALKDFQAVPGGGVTGSFAGNTYSCGTFSFLGVTPEKDWETGGDTLLGVKENNVFLGYFSLSDRLRPEAKAAVSALRQKGISSVILTGDRYPAAERVASEIGADAFYASLLPSEKTDVIRKLKKDGKVLMCGDGINDAPALTAADVGLAMGCGTDIAVESADAVMTGTGLTQVSGTVLLARRTLRVIYENLFWAFGYNLIGIPLAAGVLTPLLGWTLNPSFCALAMSFSSFLVVTNSLRLLTAGDRCYGKKKEADIPSEPQMISSPEPSGEKESTKMIVTKIEVKGMMCRNCERHVNNAVAAAFPGAECVSDHEKNLTEVTSETALDPEKLRAVIAEEGYEVGKIQVIG